MMAGSSSPTPRFATIAVMTHRSPVLLAEKQLHNVRTILNAREQRYVEARIEGMPPALSARIAGWADEAGARVSTPHPQRGLPGPVFTAVAAGYSRPERSDDAD